MIELLQPNGLGTVFVRRSCGSIFVLLTEVVLVFTGIGLCCAQEEQEAASETAPAEAVAPDTVATNVQQFVLRLEYPQSAIGDFTWLMRDWNCDDWKQKLVQARSKGNAAEAAQAEAEVTKDLFRTIRRVVLRSNEEEGTKYSDLPNVVRDKKAQCLGYAQLVYIVGNSIGLTVRTVEVLESAWGPMPMGQLHAACLVDLSDGKTEMVDIPFRFVSDPFVFKEVYGETGVCWKVKDAGNPLGVHLRIVILNEPGLLSAICSNKGWAHANAGQREQAMACFTKAVELDPKNILAYQNLGVEYGKTRQWDRAMSCLAKAIELDPKYAAAYTVRGVIHGEAGRHDQAIADLLKALEVDTTCIQAYQFLGVEYAKTGQRGQAISYFDKAIEFDPKCFVAYLGRGILHAEASQLDQAVSDFDKAIELKPQHTDAYVNRAVANALRKKKDEAREDLKKALELNPALKEQIMSEANRFGLDM